MLIREACGKVNAFLHPLSHTCAHSITHMQAFGKWSCLLAFRVLTSLIDTKAHEEFSLKTPIRRLEGISYWVIGDPDGISDFINNEIRSEWEEDLRSEGCDPKKDIWLNALPKHRWSLKVIELSRIKLDPKIMNQVDVKKGYSFQESLAKRSQELRETIERFAVVIWPPIIKSEDMTLVDGYCRYATLKNMKISKVYAYMGST